MDAWEKKLARAAELLRLDSAGKKANMREVALALEKEFNCTSSVAWSAVIRTPKKDVK